MKKRYDFSKGRPNPYAKRLKKAVTIRLDQDALEYFQNLVKETAPVPDTHQPLPTRLRCAEEEIAFALETAARKGDCLTPV